VIWFLKNIEKVILASASPRRKDIMSMLDLRVEIIPADIDESKAPDMPVEHVKFNAYGKARKIFDERGGIVIGADTIVYLDNMILGKPLNEEEAFLILKRLSGRSHKVYTGVTVISDNFDHTFYAESDVYFKNMSDNEIRWYISTGEPMDKAGSYGIQGYGAVFIDKIEGCFFNVMGLPVSRLYDVLKNLDEAGGQGV